MQRKYLRYFPEWIVSILCIMMIATSAKAATAPGGNPLYQTQSGVNNLSQQPAAQPGIPSTPPGNQSPSNSILLQIKLNTDMILKQVNSLPSLLTELTNFATNVTSSEESGAQPEAIVFSTQNYMSTLGQAFQNGIVRNPNLVNSGTKAIDSYNNNLVLLQQNAFASSQTLGTAKYDASSFTSGNKNQPPPILNVIPNIDGVSYTTALGLPPLIQSTQQGDPVSLNNYIMAASGASIFHIKPPQIKQKTAISGKQYQNYFNLTYAVQSFNNYILGKYMLGNQIVSQNQSALYSQASNSSYLANIASQPIGYVLRDILLFQSQSYLLMNKLVELQRETLMAHVMGNALLIGGNFQNEYMLFSDAGKG